MDLRKLRKLIKDKEKTELTNYKGEGWILHICKNNIPVPSFHSKDINEIEREIKLRKY